MPIPFWETNEDDGAIAMKLVVRNGYDNDYAIYAGPTDWSDEEVMSGGDKLFKDSAEALVNGISILKHQRTRNYRS